MNDLWPMIASVLGVFLMMGLGAACRRSGWLTPEADRSLANLTKNLLLPAYLFSKMLGGDSIGSIGQTWAPPLFGFVATAVGFGLAFGLARTIGPRLGLDTDGKQRAFGLCAGIANYGYIPLPLAERLYPEALVELILHNVGVELALWSIGFAIVSGKGFGWKSAITSPPLLAVIAGISLRQLGDESTLPGPLQTVVEGLGGCAIPIGLLLSGAIIVDFLREAFRRREHRDRGWQVTLVAILLRQGVLPLAMLTAASTLALSTDLRQVVGLQAAMPSAVFPIVLVRLYNRDINTALQVVLGTSIAGIVLVPFWLSWS